MIFEKDDAYWMREALFEAKKGDGLTSPNPAVGAIVVSGDKEVARGYHQKAGGSHAEFFALERAGTRAEGATLYVTLEPCNHLGKTPPCTEKILDAGIERVVIGVRDENPKVLGGGAKKLEEEGIKVEFITGEIAEELAVFYRPFFHFAKTGKPYVILKYALTLDGRTASPSGDSKWITSKEARKVVHRMRATCDAIVTGIGTVKADDPMLNVRMGVTAPKLPARVIMDPNLEISESSRIISTCNEQKTIVFCARRKGAKKHEKLSKLGAEVIEVTSKDGKLDLPEILTVLGERNFVKVMLECGATLAGSFFEEKLINEYRLFYAPRIMGGNSAKPLFIGESPALMSEALKLNIASMKKVGKDWLIVAIP